MHASLHLSEKGEMAKLCGSYGVDAGKVAITGSQSYGKSSCSVRVAPPAER